MNPQYKVRRNYTTLYLVNSQNEFSIVEYDFYKVSAIDIKTYNSTLDISNLYSFLDKVLTNYHLNNTEFKTKKINSKNTVTLVIKNGSGT